MKYTYVYLSASSIAKLKSEKRKNKKPITRILSELIEKDLQNEKRT